MKKNSKKVYSYEKGCKITVFESEYGLPANELAKQLDRFLKSPTCQGARVQVKLPQGDFRSPDGHFDIKSITLFENNVIGARESHRLVFEISTGESWRMSSIKKKV